MTSTPSYQLQTDADSALWKVAAILADRDATTEQIMQALREWSRIILARRDNVTGGRFPDPQPSSVEGIVDLVSLSAGALSKQPS